MDRSEIPSEIMSGFERGRVIPALPLALNAAREFDDRRERALIRYYIDAGAGGIAVGVHSTQFEIRDPGVGLFEAVLDLASDAMDEWCGKAGAAVMKIAGCVGSTVQAVSEARYAADRGYHACLAGLAALKDASVDDLITHCKAVADVMPVIGFYLQPAVGGRILPPEFWRRFAAIENVIGIKIAPFNRYQTFDVIRGVCESGREQGITLYTGNDDAIVTDLLTEFRVGSPGGTKSIRIKGGLLGHWGFWTKKAVELLDYIHEIVETGETAENGRNIPANMLTLGAQITDINAAAFDPANGFKGCIPGIHEMLRRQGLFEGTWCLNPDECLSPGQSEEIARVTEAYPYLNDNEFVEENLDTWLA